MGGGALKVPASLRSVDNDQLRKAAADPNRSVVIGRKRPKADHRHGADPTVMCTQIMSLCLLPPNVAFLGRHHG